MSLGFFSEYDECTLFPGVCANGECVDTSESFLCQCRPGFALDETDKNCTGMLEVRFLECEVISFVFLCFKPMDETRMRGHEQGSYKT